MSEAVSSALSENVDKMVDAAFRDTTASHLTQEEFSEWLTKNPHALDVIDALFSGHSLADDESTNGLTVDTSRSRNNSKVTFEEIISSPHSPSRKRTLSARLSVIVSSIIFVIYNVLN